MWLIAGTICAFAKNPQGFIAYLNRGQNMNISPSRHAIIDLACLAYLCIELQNLVKHLFLQCVFGKSKEEMTLHTVTRHM